MRAAPRLPAWFVAGFCVLMFGHGLVACGPVSVDVPIAADFDPYSVPVIDQLPPAPAPLAPAAPPTASTILPD